MNKLIYHANVRRAKELEFSNVEQGNMTVMEYRSIFTELSRFGRHLVDTEQRKADQFEDGLNLGICIASSSQVFSEYQDVYQRAMWIEKVLNESKIKNKTTKRFGEIQALGNITVLCKDNKEVWLLKGNMVNFVRQCMAELNDIGRHKPYQNDKDIS